MKKLDPTNTDAWESAPYKLYFIPFVHQLLTTREAAEVYNMYATIRIELLWSAYSSTKQLQRTS